MVFRSALALFLVTWIAAGAGSRASAKDDKTKALDLNQVDLEEVDDDWENQSSVPKTNPTSGLKVKDIIQPTSEYTYASFGKPDPFMLPESLTVKPEIKEEAVEEVVPSKKITVTSPLQAYPLSSLVVKGLWQTAEGEFRAVIATPKKEGVIVKAGDPISSGKILGIQRDSILVRLYKLRKDGVREYNDTHMNFGLGQKAPKMSIKLEPGKEAQFPETDQPATEPSQGASSNLKTPREGAPNASSSQVKIKNPEAKPAVKAAVSPSPATPASGASPVPAAVEAGAAPNAPKAEPSSSRPGAIVQ
jgi:Tfp pilus assembly protein PilP